MKIISAVILVFLIAGCASRGPERTSEQTPTVTYSYKPGDVEEAKQNAAKYCHDNYGRSARIVQDVQNGDKRVMTLECVVAQQ
jgi:PBP1b-binding outer membrane lipoprotein LpoB